MYIFLCSVIILFAEISSAHAYSFFLSDSNYANLDTLNSDSTRIDSLGIPDSLRTKPPKIKLMPLYERALLESKMIGTTLTTRELYKTNYRYSGDFSNLYPNGFLQDLGSLGQPNEITLYGLGYGSIGLLKDGMTINNRWQNSYDWYHFQSETIDSLELVPLSRGFYYSPFNNPVSINFITKSNVDFRPLSRIRFYQAPNDEALVDVLFNTYLFKRTTLRIQVSNSSIENIFGRDTVSSDYSSWKVLTSLRYMVNNNINVIGTYNFLRTTIGLYGGLREEELGDKLITSIPIYSDRTQKTINHNFNLKLLGTFIKEFPGELNFFYQFNDQFFKQGFETRSSRILKIENTNKFTSYGINFRQALLLEDIQLEVLANYEQTKFDTDILKSNSIENALSIGGKGELDIYETFFPAAYVKLLRYNNETFFGLGADLAMKISDEFSLFAGGSFFAKPYSILERQYRIDGASADKQNITTFEGGLKFNLPVISGSANYFYYNNDNQPIPVIDQYSDSLLINEVGYFNTHKLTSSGLNLSFDINIWVLLLSTKFSYFMNYDTLNSIPQFSLAGGLYFVDKMFDGNLELKTGINYRYVGSKNYITYDFEKSRGVRFFSDNNSAPQLISTEMVPTAFQLDFFLAATIDELAIFYFVLENLLDEVYYLVPYYPMYRSGIRFGVSWEIMD